MLDWLFSNDVQVEQFTWARPISLTAMLLVFGAIVVLTIFFYKRLRGAPPMIRLALCAARMVVLCLIVAALFEPTVTLTEPQTTKRRLAVLVDVSQSMSVRDHRKRPEEIVEAATALGMLPFSQSNDANNSVLGLSAKQRQAIASASRLDLTKSLLSKPAREMLESIGEDIEVSYYAFGKKLDMLSDGQSGTADVLASLEANASGTSIAQSLEAVASADRGAPLAGIVLLSDGLDTSLRRADATGNDLGAQRFPVFTVPIGVANPDDVSIRNIIMQEVAFSGDKVPVRVQIRSQGYEKRSANLSVLLNGRGVAQRGISLQGGLQFEDIFFNVDVHEKGVAHVEVVIEPFGDEATAENNRVQRSVRVVNEKINVLCIEGSARWEYRYLRAMLKRDPRINATFIATRSQPEMARNSSDYIVRFPDKREDAFQYDLVILGDVDASFFTTDEFARLEELVKERGGSLLMLCGARFAPTSYADTPVERMLPVRFDSKGEWEDVDDNVYPVLTPEGRSSLMLTLEVDQAENDRVWSRVAPMDRVPPFLAPKPGATVLAELSDTHTRSDRFPLMAWHRYGTGKCMVMGTDRLWLLRFKTGDKYHWRAWSQCIQFLTLSRLMGEHKRIRLETDRTIYQNGGQVLLYAHVLDDVFDPISQSGFEVAVHMLDDDGASQRVTLRPDMTTPGLYEGYFSPPRPGRYRMEANDADRDISSTTEFQVADIKPEMANTDMQIDRLRRIADVSGGQCLSIPEFQKLSSLLNLAPQTTTVRVDRPLWDNGWIMGLFVVLLGVEWIVRRRYDLP
ncbi:MAG: hypothetical protein ACI87E_001543 [Mariniblastus sp.]|jgi:hypothetical protein